MLANSDPMIHGLVDPVPLHPVMRQAMRGIIPDKLIYDIDKAGCGSHDNPCEPVPAAHNGLEGETLSEGTPDWVAMYHKAAAERNDAQAKLVEMARDLEAARKLATKLRKEVDLHGVMPGDPPAGVPQVVEFRFFIEVRDVPATEHAGQVGRRLIADALRFADVADFKPDAAEIAWANWGGL